MIGPTIKRIRKYHRQTQLEFGESIGVTQSCISSIERNSSYPSIKILKRISVKINVPLFLLVWAGICEEEVDAKYKREFSILKPVVDASLYLVFGESAIFRCKEDVLPLDAEQHIKV